MSFYENTNCPVCGKQFKNDDDVVTCPICGTPHHRECYEKLGKCANEELHKDGFDFYDSHKKEEQKSNNQEKNNKATFYNPNNSNINKDLASQSQTNNNDDSNKSANQFTPTPTTIYTTYDNDKELIDGKSVSDVALSVGVNAQSFIPKFKQLSRKEKKFKWNWCAFIFGPFYMMFRKMYKAGTAFFTANIVTTLLAGAACFKFAPECAGLYVKALSGELAANATSMADQTVALQNALQSATDVNTFMMIVNIAMIILFTLKIVIGFVTNTLYKNQIINNINKIESDLNDSTKTQNIFMYSMGQMPTDEDLRKMMLVKKGNVSFFAPLLAYFALEAIMMIITSFI